MFLRKKKFFPRMILLLLAVMIFPAAHSQEKIWVEAEHFDDHGGWVNDWQFIDQMGSSYLMAAGYGEKVKDAVTEIKTTAPGKYRLWVRSNDWFPEKHPGRCRRGVARQN
jgi:hypothetical protein